MNTIALYFLLLIPPEDYCGVVYDEAYHVMEKRQQGVEYTILLHDADSVLVKNAFEHPQYLTENNQESVTIKFAEKHYKLCIGGGE